MTNIGVTLTADDQQLIAILNRVEGKLDSLGKVSSTAMNQTSVAAAQAAGALKNVERQAGMTENGMNAALRTVPAQFTDIVTSLQGGQPVLQVLLQQGGQLKDTFNGIIPAARALGGYIWGLINPYTVLAAAAVAVGAAFMSGREEFARTQRALIMSGDAAGVTAGQMQAIAATLDDIGGGTQGKAADVLLQMAAAGIQGSAALQSVTNTAIELERAGGPAVEETVKAFAALGKDPVQASVELNKTTNFLTVSLFNQIKALQEQGRTTEAAALAQQAYDDAMKARIPVLEAQLGLLQKMWRGVADAAKETWDAMLGIGRPDTTLSKLQAAQKKLALTAGSIYGRGDRPGQEQEVRDLSRRAVIEMEVADAKDVQNRQIQAGIKWSQDHVQVLSRQEKLERDITKAREEAAQAGGGPEVTAQMERRIALMQQNADPGINLQKIRDAEAQKLEVLRRSENEIARQRAMGVINERGQIEATTAITLQSIAIRRQAVAGELAIVSKKQDSERETAALQGQIAMLDQERITAQKKGRDDLAVSIYKQQQAIKSLVMAQQEEIAQEQADFYVRESKAREDASLVTYAYSKSVKEAGAALEFETSLLGLTREEREKRLAQYKIEIALREKLSAIDKTFGTDPAGDMERQRVRETAAKEIAQIEGRAYLNEWQRTWDSLADGLSEALIQGFKGGAAGAADFKRQVERTLRSVFIKPMVDNAVKSILGSVQIWVGQAFDAARGGAAGATSKGGLMDLLSLVGGGGFNLGAAASNAGVYSGAAYGTGFMSQQSQMLAAQEAGMSSAAGAAGIGSMVSAAMPYVAVAIAGSQLAMKDQAAGFTARAARETGDGVGGKYGVGTVFAETANVLKKLGLNEKWADILSMSTGFSKVFGRSTPQATDQGISGTIGGGRANLQAFQDWKAKGGLFRSDKTGTNTAALEQAQQAALNESAKGVFDSVAEWASVLKLPAKQLSDVTQDVRVSLGNDGEKNAEAIAKVMNDYREALAKSLGPAIEPMRKFGETASAALERLSTLQTFSNDLNSLGGVFSRLSGLSVNARESFIGMVGGMEALRSQAKSFVENFYKREEIAGIKAREIQDALRAVGITGDVNTRDQFRALVEGSDINTEAGRLQLATLLQAQGSFVDVADYLQEVGGTLSSIAAQAPQMGAIGGILSAPEQAQLDAINSVTSAVNEVRDAIIELGNRQSGAPQSFPSDTWEVNPNYSTSDGP